MKKDLKCRGVVWHLRVGEEDMWLFNRIKEGEEIRPGFNVEIDREGRKLRSVNVYFVWPLRKAVAGDTGIGLMFRIRLFSIESICPNCDSWISKESLFCPLCNRNKEGRTWEEVNDR